MMLSSNSQVARLRQRIEDECVAMRQMMTGMAATASHQSIQHKYNSIGQVHEQLIHLVGEEEATTILTETYNQVLDTGERMLP